MDERAGLLNLSRGVFRYFVKRQVPNPFPRALDHLQKTGETRKKLPHKQPG